MHEFSIMEGALSVAFEQARRAGAVRVHVLRLRVGALSGVVPEALELAFEALKTGTVAENAQLEIESVPARFWCGPCGREFVSELMIAECPDCGGLSREVRSGKELEVASMEVE